MKIVLNGETRDCAAGSLMDLWREETGETGTAPPQGYAIALNGSLVPREAWKATELREDDRVEIVRAMQGG